MLFYGFCVSGDPRSNLSIQISFTVESAGTIHPPIKHPFLVGTASTFLFFFGAFFIFTSQVSLRLPWVSFIMVVGAKLWSICIAIVSKEMKANFKDKLSCSFCVR